MAPERTPVIIEVAINGATSVERNPNVPTTQEALVEDTLCCIEAGASIIHTHALDIQQQGQQAADAYRGHFAPVLERHPDVVLYPTLVFADAIEEKTSHIEALVRDCGLRMGFVDPGSLNLAPTDDDGLPMPAEWVYTNSFNDIAYKMALCDRLGLAPGMAIFEPGFLRAVFQYDRAGKLPQGTFLRFYLGGEASYRGGAAIDLLFGLPAEARSLDVYVDMLERSDSALPWSVAVLSGDVMENDVARRAIERGGHVRVGLEDFAGARTPSNAELVAEVAALCASLGRRVARPDEVGKILGMPR